MTEPDDFPRASRMASSLERGLADMCRGLPIGTVRVALMRLLVRVTGDVEVENRKDAFLKTARYFEIEAELMECNED